MLGGLVDRFRKPTSVWSPDDYPAEYSQAEVNHYYFGHHKCATNWIRRLAKDVCDRSSMNYLIYQGDNRTNSFSSEKRPTFHLFVNSRPSDLRHFSWKHSHRINSDHQKELRKTLRRSGPEQGFIYLLDHCAYFEQIQSWDLGCDPRVLDVRYEDLIADEKKVFGQILSHLGIEISEEELQSAIDSHSFQSITGREPGQENPRDHFRKGVAGDWRNYFERDGALKRAVYQRIGPLIDRLGYER